jgi:hypothetical protein
MVRESKEGIVIRIDGCVLYKSDVWLQCSQTGFGLEVFDLQSSPLLLQQAVNYTVTMHSIIVSISMAMEIGRVVIIWMFSDILASYVAMFIPAMWTLSGTARTAGPGTEPPSLLLIHMRASCGNRHGTITTTASLNIIAVHTGCSAVVVNAYIALLLSVVVDVFEVEGVNVTREDAGNCQSFVPKVTQERRKSRVP